MDIGTAWKIATALTQGQGRANVLPDWCRTPGDAFAAILYGHEYGMSPMQAINDLQYGRGGFDVPTKWKVSRAIAGGVRIKPLVISDDKVRIRFMRDGHEAFEHEMLMADARRAGLAGKDTWQKHPQRMLTAMVLRSGLELYAADLVRGGIDADETAPLAEDPEPTQIKAVQRVNPVPGDGEDAYQSGAEMKDQKKSWSVEWWEARKPELVSMLTIAQADSDNPAAHKARVEDQLFKWLIAHAARWAALAESQRKSSWNAMLRIVEALGYHDPRKRLLAWIEDARGMEGEL